MYRNKLFVVVDPEQCEAVFIHPDVREYEKFIQQLRDELNDFEEGSAEGCSDHDVLEMYGGWVGHYYHAEWLSEGNW
jgi:hypothetical protein